MGTKKLLSFARTKLVSRRVVTMVLIVVLSLSSASGGIHISSTDGLSFTGADGVTYGDSMGLSMTGADSLLALASNGITAPILNGLSSVGIDGITYIGNNIVSALNIKVAKVTKAAGTFITGPNPITVTNAAGETMQVAGAFIRQADGISSTGAETFTAVGIRGISTTGADNSIARADGAAMKRPGDIFISKASDATLIGLDGSYRKTSPDGLSFTGADGLSFTGADGLSFTGADGLSFTGADGLSFTGADGLSFTGADALYRYGNVMHTDNMAVKNPDLVEANAIEYLNATAINSFTVVDSNGVTHTAKSAIFKGIRRISAVNSDTLNAMGADNISSNGSSVAISRAGGIVITSPETINIAEASDVKITKLDGSNITIPNNNISIRNVDGISGTGADGLSFTGADYLDLSGASNREPLGLLSFDPELALILDKLSDDSFLNIAIVYHKSVTDADIADLQRIGVLGGSRYHVLPVVLLSAGKKQISEISKLPAVRSIYADRTLSSLGEPGYGMTGTARVKQDADLKAIKNGQALTGKGVTVAVLDTGLDSTHADLRGRVVKNVKFVSTLGTGVGFNYPTALEGLPNTDLVSGHGTFVSGIIGGSGASSNGQYSGIAPGVRLVGLGAGDLDLFWILEGIDYLLTKGSELGVKVVNCSFSAATVYDPNDPVNIGTKMLVDRGINVVFSAGNKGPSMRTLNPYAMAPWVISVGATDETGRLAAFSARGTFDNPNARPSVVAPGVNVVSLRASGVNLNGLGVLVPNILNLGLLSSLSYMTGSGTSFSAPQVAGTIALMLEANPLLTPADVRDILQRSATPMPPYFRHDVGAGMLNAHAAVLESAFPVRRMGTFRASIASEQVKFINEPLRPFFGTVNPGSSYMSSLAIPDNTLLASVQVAWGRTLNLNDLAMRLTDPRGGARAEVNSLSLLGLKGRHEGDTLYMPLSGQWNIEVKNKTPLLASPQSFVGALELIRVEYSEMSDLDNVPQLMRDDIQRSIRALIMSPIGNKFHPTLAVSRADFAQTLMMGARVPQYLAGNPIFTDVTDMATRLVSESVYSGPRGPLFPDAVRGGAFNPNQAIDRLTAAIVLVNAAGLKNSATASSCAALSTSDAASIPCKLRGYVKIALDRGYLILDNGAFKPTVSLTRSELAHAMVNLLR